MKKSELKIGSYYLVKISNEVEYQVNENMAGKLLEISNKSTFRYSNRLQSYLFEFINNDDIFHDGLNMSKVKHISNRCYFVSLSSILKKLNQAELVAHEL